MQVLIFFLVYFLTILWLILNQYEVQRFLIDIRLTKYYQLEVLRRPCNDIFKNAYLSRNRKASM